MSPKCILVLSGKRKTGKDYLADLLQQRIGCDKCQVLRLSGPLKKQYAQEHGLNFEELLDSTSYKEIHRVKMIKWGEDKRNEDPYFFCNKTVASACSDKPVWIVSDARRKTDVQYFQDHFSAESKFVRISAPVGVRKQRGFVFTSDVDDAESECGLDEGVSWDFEITNNGDCTILDLGVQQVLKTVNNLLQDT